MGANDTIGFTGTQNGMTKAQQQELSVVLQYYQPSEFHHGDCIGADAEAHTIALGLRIAVVLHPPDVLTKRAFCKDFARAYMPAPYLVRNQDIVICTNRLIATPKVDFEERRSGTWSTIRCARRMGKPVMIIYPDGKTNY